MPHDAPSCRNFAQASSTLNPEPGDQSQRASAVHAGGKPSLQLSPNLLGRLDEALPPAAGSSIRRVAGEIRLRSPGVQRRRCSCSPRLSSAGEGLKPR